MTDEPDAWTQAVQRTTERRERYRKEVLGSQAFKDGIRRLEGLADDFTLGLGCAALMAPRLPQGDQTLIYRFGSLLIESSEAVIREAKSGRQNPARRELRFLLEAVVKFSARDTHQSATDFEARLAGLADRGKRFEDYVAELIYFGEFESPKEANDTILSLYAELSGFVHVGSSQLEYMLRRDGRGEPVGMESVATLDRFNDLAFQVYEVVLVRTFTNMGVSMAGDIFTGMLDDHKGWRFHKGKFTSRLSRCFDYKHERKVVRAERKSR